MNASELLKRNLENLNDRIRRACSRVGRARESIRVVAVTKYVDADTVRGLVALGVRDLGENRLKVAAPKLEALRDLPIRWHWIGTLQTNKVRKALEFFETIHSVDRLSLIEALERGYSEKRPEGTESKLPVYLQVNVSGEASKAGVSQEEAPRLVERLRESTQLECLGLMTMAPYSEDPENARPTFAGLRELRDRTAKELGTELPRLSMGMTDDFEVAIEEGATDLRIGRLLYEGLLD
jgi:hypothetical protein